MVVPGNVLTEDIVLENLFAIRVLYLVVVRVLLLRVFHYSDGDFVLIFSLFYFFLAVCILDVFRYLVGVEAGCNWYLCDINVFPL